MALAREPRMGLVQTPDLSSQISYEMAPEMVKNGGFAKNNGFLFCSSNYQPDVSHSVINFKNQIDQNLIHLSTDSSLLSFGQTQQVAQDNYFNWPAEGESLANGCQWSQMISSSSLRLLEDLNCFQKASNFTPMDNPSKEKQNGSDGSGNYWLYSEESDVIVEEESRTAHEQNPHKRPHLMDNEQSMKKQCNNSPKKTSPKTSPSKDPQSIAAKNRRERISDRLKTLQELVPNGSKVDLVTMLEKAISYVKFLQLQVKILATDEFWPVQGGKAPDISQVRDAIDAILSSQRDRSSSSNSAMLSNGS